ncbi:MAG: hypothetical protein Q7S31_00590, partial [bacterium]|nr:hypothetical protein [bacterium]
MKRYLIWSAIVLVVAVAGLSGYMLLFKPQKQSAVVVQPDDLESILLIRPQTSISNQISNLIPFKSETQRVEDILAKTTVDPSILPKPELYSEADLVSWTGGISAQERYQIIGTVNGFANDQLSLQAKDISEIKTNQDTIIACISTATPETEFKDYSQYYVDYQAFVPFNVTAQYLQGHYQM